MTDQVLFITGGGSGMGQLAARRALDSGYKVAALDVSEAGLKALGEHAGLLKLVVDITDEQAVNAAVEKTLQELGPITRVLNAAAIMPLGQLMDQPASLARKIMDINYQGLVHVAHATLPGMLARGQGEFVSFASMAGLIPLINIGAYNASKFAVVAYTEVLAEENRDKGIRFCCVCPPMVATPLLDQARETVWPRIFNLLPPIKPETVLDKIDKALTRNRFWIIPGPLSGTFVRVRRFFPGFLRWFNRIIEKRGPAEPLFK